MSQHETVEQIPPYAGLGIPVSYSPNLPDFNPGERIDEKSLVVRQLANPTEHGVVLETEFEGKSAATKIYSIADRDKVRRAWREISVHALLEGKGPTSVLDWGVAAKDGKVYPYSTTELMPGTLESLDLRRTGGAVSFVEKFADTMVPVLRTLEVMQSRHGLVHGDIKPANILVDPSGKGRLNDFGGTRIAHEPTATTRAYETLGSTDLCNDMLTDHMHIGTPGFVDPDHIESLTEGEELIISFDNDMFALCATSYYVLTKRLPFKYEIDDTTRIITSKPTFRNLQPYELPPPPHDLNRRVPKELGELILSGFSNNRPTMAQFDDRLCAIAG